MEREQLAEERKARRRAATIIAQLTQANASLASREPELAAPDWGRDGRKIVPEDAGGGEYREAGSEKPLWKRVFGG